MTNRLPATRALLLAGYLVAQLLFVFTASDAFLLRLDDTFYYFGIARHAAESGRFSFDGIHLTNGFQLLWQFMLVGVTWVASHAGVQDRSTMMHLYFVLCAALNTVALWLAMGLVDQVFPQSRRSAALALFWFLWFPGLTVSLLGGMESCVNWPLLIAFFRLLHDDEGRIGIAHLPVRRFAALCAVSALLVYARLDNAVLLAVTVLYLWIRDKRELPIARVVVWGAVTLAVWAPSLLWGQHVFASPTPISGTVKVWNTTHFIARFGALTYAKSVIEAFVLSILGLPASATGMGYYELLKPLVMKLGFTRVVGALGVALVGAAAIGVSLLRRHQPPPRQPAPSIFPLLVTLSVVHLLTLTVMFPDQWMYAGLIWYDLVEYLCLFVFLGWIGGWLLSALGDNAWMRLERAAVALCFLSMIPMAAWRPAQPTEGQIKRIAAEWINAHLPPDAIVASDDAGVLGYFSRVPVVNLDGLVNNRDYLDNYLRKGRKKDYLRDAGITHLADIDCPKPGARFRSLLHIPEDATLLFTTKGNEADLDFCLVEIKR